MMLKRTMRPPTFSRKAAVLSLFVLLLFSISVAILYPWESDDAKRVPTANAEKPESSKIVSKDRVPSAQNAGTRDAEKRGTSENSVSKGKEAAQKRCVTEEERIRSGRILTFFNQAENNCSEAWNSEADRIAFFIYIYLGEWQLPKFVPQSVSRAFFHRKLDPPADLAGEFDGPSLRNAVDAMYDASAGMKKAYRDLELYVMDASIVDEGVQGKRLARQITGLYGQFCQARKRYFSLLEEKALRAEDLLLEEYPLKRQIQESRNIFTVFRDISLELSKEETSWTRMQELGQHLATHLHEAEKPPFKDKPLKERAFRVFIRDVHVYYDEFMKGIAEGFSPQRRKALNEDQSRCRSSYNAFAEYSNRNTEHPVGSSSVGP